MEMGSTDARQEYVELNQRIVENLSLGNLQVRGYPNSTE